MYATMASPRTKKPASKPRPKTEGRRKDSLFATTGEAGRREAQRKLLLRALKEQHWNLRATADALGMSGTPHVLRAIQDVGLADEYEAAKERGDVSPGSRRS